MSREFLMSPKPTVEVTSTVTVKIKGMELQLTIAETRDLISALSRAIGVSDLAPTTIRPSLYPTIDPLFKFGGAPVPSPGSGDWIPNPNQVTC